MAHSLNTKVIPKEWLIENTRGLAIVDSKIFKNCSIFKPEDFENIDGVVITTNNYDSLSSMNPMLRSRRPSMEINLRKCLCTDRNNCDQTKMIKI